MHKLHSKGAYSCLVPPLKHEITPADFPDAFRANLWVRGLSDDRSADEALSDFKVRLDPPESVTTAMLIMGCAFLPSLAVTACGM